MTDTDRYFLLSAVAALMFSMLLSDPEGFAPGVFDFLANILGAFVIARVLRE